MQRRLRRSRGLKGTSVVECPDACNIRLEHLEEGQKESKEVHSELFSKINTANACISKRVKTVTLLGLAAVIVIVLGGAFMLLYDQGTSIGAQIGVTHQRITTLGNGMHEIDKKVIKVQEQLKAQKEDIEELKEGQ